ncbi:MAG: glycosyltransferase family 4 protein [Candidatus Nitrosopolaris sp.]
MNIIFISQFYFRRVGGVEVHVREIAERLAKENNVVVYTLDDATKHTTEVQINGIKIKSFGCLSLGDGIVVPSKEFAHSLRNSCVDIVHLHGTHTLLAYYTYRRIPENSKFIITTHYHGEGHNFIYDILLRLYKLKLSNVLMAADKIICVSKYERSRILQDFPVQADKVVVIPNGVSQAVHFNGTDNNERDTSKILFVGRLQKYKNADKVVKALSLLPKFNLVIVGEGPENDRILKLIEHLNLSDRVRIVSNLSQEDLLKEYKTSSIFVLPSDLEAFSIVVAEALSMGLQTIVANSSALSEFVTDGYAYGISLPVTPEKIARVVNDVWDKPKHNTYLPYSWDMVVRELTHVYESLY